MPLSLCGCVDGQVCLFAVFGLVVVGGWWAIAYASCCVLDLFVGFTDCSCEGVVYGCFGLCVD